MSVNSRLKATMIIGQRKAFYRQIIPESSYARKETVDIPSQKSKLRFNQEKARFNQDEYNFNGINQDLSEILS